MFFDKFAKLKSTVDSDGTGFTINVYDDEVSTDKPIMWLMANVANARERLKSLVSIGVIGESTKAELQEKYETVVFVNIVDTDSSMYFELPENRRNTCATSLFKRFILHYKQNFNDQLVSANFANYDLQEKFKVAIEKGIFPKDSLKIIGETTKEVYDDSLDYNINNKEKMYNMLKELSTVLSEKGLDTYIEGEKVFVKNPPITTLLNETSLIVDILKDKYPILSKSRRTEGNLLNGDYIFSVPIELFESYENDLTYDASNTRVIVYDNLVDSMLQNESRFREIFNEATHVLVSGMSDEVTFTVDEFFQQNQVEAKIIKRMIRKGE